MMRWAQLAYPSRSNCSTTYWITGACPLPLSSKPSTCTVATNVSLAMNFSQLIMSGASDLDVMMKHDQRKACMNWLRRILQGAWTFQQRLAQAICCTAHTRSISQAVDGSLFVQSHGLIMKHRCAGQDACSHAGKKGRTFSRRTQGMPLLSFKAVSRRRNTWRIRPVLCTTTKG